MSEENVKEPQTSYVTDEEGNEYEIIEYGLEDKYILMDAFEEPNYTQVPNQLLGSWERDADDKSTFIVGMAADMTEAELRVCLALCRLTYGFHRDHADGPLDFLQTMTGMSRQGVLNGIEKLTERGLFSKESKRGTVTKWQRCDGGESLPGGLEKVYEVDLISPRSRPNKERLKKERNYSLSEKTAKAAEDPIPAEDYTISHYYKSTDVTVLGTRTKGPWSVICPNCEDNVTIYHFGKPAASCLCGMHEFILTKHRPKAEVQRENEAVEAYYLISGRKRGTIAHEWIQEIEKTVTDVQFWRQVVKEWCGRGWNRGDVSTMLKYYTEGRLPGTRKKVEEQQSGPREEVINGRKTLIYEEEPQKKGYRIEVIDGVQTRIYD